MANSIKHDLKRFRRVRWFFAKVLLQIILWDVILNYPLLRWFRSSPLSRWQKVARAYKEMAMEMGGQKQPETKIPTSQMTMRIECKEVSPQGDMGYEFKMEKADVVADPNANPMMVNAIKQSLNSLVGMSG